MPVFMTPDTLMEGTHKKELRSIVWFVREGKRRGSEGQNSLEGVGVKVELAIASQGRSAIRCL